MNQPDQQFINARFTGPLVVAVLVAIVLGAANLVMGDLNQDEGWYLYAALRVAEGWLPYRDFAFTQGPMLPLVYSLFSPVVEGMGVGGGRAMTWLLGFASAALAGLTARRLGGASAGVLAFSLIAINVYQSYYTTVVKTYSLCALFLMIGTYAMARWVTSDKQTPRRAGWLILAGIALAAAAGTRVSAGVMLPLFGLWLLFQIPRWGKYSWLWFGLSSGFALMAIFLPFYVSAPEGFLFGLFEYHTLRDSGGGLQALVFKGGFISRLIQVYFIPASLLALMIAAKLWRPFKGTDTGYHQSDTFSYVRVLWAAVAAVTLIHFLAPFPYDDYQVPVFPVLAIALAVSWSYALRAWSGLGYRWKTGEVSGDPGLTVWFVWGVLLLNIAAAFSSPINQDWMIAGRDRIWWNIKKQPALIQLRNVARELKEWSRDNELLTQDTYLAVEAGLRVPRGWEMGPFSYYPEMPDEQAAKLHLVNEKMLLESIDNASANVAAFSGYGLAIASPDVSPLDAEHQAKLFNRLEQRYALIREVPTFGQAGTTLKIYTSRSKTEDHP